MNNLKLLIGRDNSFKNCTSLILKASITGRRGDAPRTLSVTLSDSEGHDRLAANCEDGLSVLFYVNGNEEFRGLLMTDSGGSSRKLSLKAYDECIYLCKNKGSFSYKKKTATYIFKDCLKKLGLKLGSAADTGHVIGELIKKNTTYWDVIEDALSQTYKSTGVRYYVYASKGKIYLKKRQEQTTMPMLTLKSNIQTYERSRSIYNIQTRLTLATSKGKKKGSYTNSTLEKKIGKFADIENVDEDISKTEINQRINVFKTETSVSEKELKVKATGDMRCVAGSCVYVKISTEDIKRIMYVEEDIHTFEKDQHSMELKLSYEKTSSSGGNKKTSVTYVVTANSGLNLRKKANSTIIVTMPKGSKVTSDGKKDGNWIHVNYNGTWGYAYNSWLKST